MTVEREHCSPDKVGHECPNLELPPSLPPAEPLADHAKGYKASEYRKAVGSKDSSSAWMSRSTVLPT